jgi:hypothetical protein
MIYAHRDDRCDVVDVGQQDTSFSDGCRQEKGPSRFAFIGDAEPINERYDAVGCYRLKQTWRPWRTKLKQPTDGVYKRDVCDKPVCVCVCVVWRRRSGDTARGSGGPRQTTGG